MSLTAAKPVRRCGKAYASADEVTRSKGWDEKKHRAHECVCGSWHRRTRPKSSPRGSGGAAKARKAAARNTGDCITPQVCAKVDGRDSLDGLRMCVHCGSPRNLHRHHRRFRSHPGPHKHCACNIVTVCDECHHWAHVLNRREAEAEGIVLDAEVTEPWKHPVLVHEADGAGAMAWPSCDGRWLDHEPEAVAA